MKKILGTIALGFMLVTSVSCTDFLNLNPTTQPSESTFWQTENDFNMALAGIYGKIRANSYYNDWFALTDNLSDNSFDKNGCGDAQWMNQGEIYPSCGGYVDAQFSFGYSLLARVNIFLKYADQSKALSADIKTRMVAEAKFFRAYAHMWLYMFYGSVPVITEPLTLEKQYVPKSTAEEVYAQIIKDYDDAIAGLPKTTYKEAGGHITSDAAKAFKAKVMLQHAYNKGVPNIKEMGDILTLLESIKGYSLQPEYGDLFKTSTQEDSPEIMFSVKNLAPSSCMALDMYYTNWLHTCPLRNLVDEFELEGEGAWIGSEASKKINEDVINDPESPVEAQEAERAKLFIGRDKRLTATIFHSNHPFPDLRHIEGETDYTGFGCYKYLQYPTTGDLLDGDVSDQDMIHMRYGYVLLMIAEVENEINGATSKAYDAVNQIRERAGQKPLPAGLDKDAMRVKIRHEWRVETAMEGLHYFEMKRWHTLGDIVNIKDPKHTDYQCKFEEKFYNWPIPQGEIDKANGVLVQNPDYL